MLFYLNMVTSHVIGTDLPTILHSASFLVSWQHCSCTRALRGKVATRGYFASRNNGIMDNEDLPPSSILLLFLENLDLKHN